MLRQPLSLPYRVLLPSVVLLACGGTPEESASHGDATLGTKTSALCSGQSVETLSVSGMSSYAGLLAGNGTWSVGGSANAVRLEHFIDGVLRSTEERPGRTGTWYVSADGMTCGAHAFVVKAYPMIIDSNGNQTTCWDAPRQTSQSVDQPCPTVSMSCMPESRINSICTGTASGGTGPYTPFWKVNYTSEGNWFQGQMTFNLFCPPEPYPKPARIEVLFKVRDSTGMDSPARTTTILCK
ncbi:hypothetical protein [Stigmatella hybrida]|uniref:hypothetical protein n=1 Tax=Stigmatella hybrida TaxID=394097 RepID=UPI001CDA695E|nr:hypothetical protein [Stigmatella hybrida]